MPKTFTCSNSGDAEIMSHNYVEICIDPNLLNNFANEEGIGAYLESTECSEEFEKLKRQLIREVMGIVETCLTDKQKLIIQKLYVEGKTQMEVAKELNRDQSSVHKSVKGNLTYNNRKRYGGSIKKIKKLCFESKKIQEILKSMRVLNGQT